MQSLESTTLTGGGYIMLHIPGNRRIVGDPRKTLLQYFFVPRIACIILENIIALQFRDEMSGCRFSDSGRSRKTDGTV